VAEAAPDAAAVAAPPAVRAGLPSALPWAAAWVFRQDPLLPGPARRPSARLERATALSPIAWPSALWWQARLFADLSWWFGSLGNCWKIAAREASADSSPRSRGSTNKRWAGMWRLSNGIAYLLERLRCWAHPCSWRIQPVISARGMHRSSSV